MFEHRKTAMEYSNIFYLYPLYYDEQCNGRLGITPPCVQCGTFATFVAGLTG
jgi:hypothetical protein